MFTSHPHLWSECHRLYAWLEMTGRLFFLLFFMMCSWMSVFHCKYLNITLSRMYHYDPEPGLTWAKSQHQNARCLSFLVCWAGTSDKSNIGRSCTFWPKSFWLTACLQPICRYDGQAYIILQVITNVLDSFENSEPSDYPASLLSVGLSCCCNIMLHIMFHVILSGARSWC